MAVLHEPKIVFLDEPTGGVDPITRRQFWEMIYEAAGRGITVFVTTHYMDEAEYCDRISIMSEGKIVALDTPADLKRQYNAASVEEVFVKIARPVDPPALLRRRLREAKKGAKLFRKKSPLEEGWGQELKGKYNLMSNETIPWVCEKRVPAYIQGFPDTDNPVRDTGCTDPYVRICCKH